MELSVSAIRELIRLTDPVAIHASLRAHPDDDMLAFSRAAARSDPLGTMAYFRAGMQIVDVVARIADWRFGGLDKVGSFLDFAAGYGRSTRFLVQHLHPSRICVSEIQADALAFQASEFGVETLLSHTDPGNVPADRRYDMVFVASLFTHLPERSFGPWLGKVWEFVAPEGVLVFSVHDEAVNDTGAVLVDGFSFTASSEVASLSTEDYGTNYTTEEFVHRQLDAAVGCEAAAQAIRLPRALCFLQDLWVVCRGEVPDAALRLECGPTGHVDALELAPMTLRGWAADRGACDERQESHRIRAVSVYRNGALVTQSEPHLERPDVAAHLGKPDDSLFRMSGWQATVGPKNLLPNDIITAVAECEHGARFVLDSTRVHDILERTHTLETLPWQSRLNGRWRTARGRYRDVGPRGVLRYSATKLARLTHRVP